MSYRIDEQEKESLYKSIKQTAIAYIKQGEIMPLSPASLLNLIDDYCSERKAREDAEKDCIDWKNQAEDALQLKESLHEIAQEANREHVKMLERAEQAEAQCAAMREALVDADSNMSYIACRHYPKDCPITKEELYASAIKCRELYENTPRAGISLLARMKRMEYALRIYAEDRNEEAGEIAREALKEVEK